MQQYSIAISIYGWSAKNLLTGKENSGGYEMLPAQIAKELSKLIHPSSNSLCVASTIDLPEDNLFHIWFMATPSYSYSR